MNTRIGKGFFEEKMADLKLRTFICIYIIIVRSKYQKYFLEFLHNNANLYTPILNLSLTPVLHLNLDLKPKPNLNQS